MNEAEPRALVCDVQRFSVHDGPGIRTVLFLKGCPLRCRWCQNPETLRFQNELVFSAERCVACGDCARACDRGAIRFEGGPRIDWERCDLCLACAEVCPGRALEPAGVARSAEEVLPELLADRDYFQPEGGITLSGGEPLAHPDFLARLLPLLRREGLTVAAETAGLWDYERLAPILAQLDLVLFDLKAASPDRHRELTGAGNDRILANLRRLRAEGPPVILRMPAVPGLNTRPHDLAEMTKLLHDLGADQLWLLPYHRLGEKKLAKLHTDLHPLGIAPPRKEDLLAWARVLKDAGISPRTPGFDLDP